tara:strand:+ start:226 stop:828 length:603 start_codon:yes stop_codon:yes gene_type:complete
LINLFKSGGVVMWPLLLLSILSLSFIFERFFYWNNLANINNNNITQFTNLNYLKDINKKEIINNPYKKLLFKIKNFDLSTQRNLSIALSISLQSIQSEFDRYNNFFATTIAVAPLLGLLGTVFGLINSFSFIDIGNAGVNADEVTGGISEALISTAAGLIIAIINLVFTNYFKSIKNKQLRLMNEFCGKYESFFSSKNLN